MSQMNRRGLLRWSGLLLANCAAAGAKGQDLICDRLCATFASTARSASEYPVDELLSMLAPDGHWPDIAVKHPAPSQSGVGRYVHYLRLWKMAAAWRQSSNPRLRGILADAIRRAFPLWLDKPAPASIPWFRQIGTPQALARATLIFASELPPEQVKSAIAIMRNCVRPDGVLDYAGSLATGQNLQHEAEVQIVVACLTGDTKYLSRYASAIEREIGVRGVEGLQPDWSFHQHGPQLYSGALYGTGFARDGATLAWAVEGTEFAFRPATIESLVRYVLDGQQWMTRGATFDFLTTGRLLSWPDYIGVEPEGDQGVPEACDQLAKVEPRRARELAAFGARLRRKARPESAPTGNRVFWMSDYVAHQKPHFFASVRMTSRRVYGAESGSGQNELGYHLADGGMAIMRSGDEYRGIFPLWDWRRVPGVSAVQNPAAPFPKHQWGRGSEGWSDFAGGVSDGALGAAAMENNRAGLYVRKAWFFLEDAVLCLGADMLPHDPTWPVFTSVDQRWGSGPAQTSAGDRIVEGQTVALKGPSWVSHDGITYLFPEATIVKVRMERKSAPWSVINQAPHGSMFRKSSLSDVIASGDVFSVWMDHGLLGKAIGYHYAIAPGLASDDVDRWKETGPKVLSNDSQVQAIARDGLVQAVFWTSAELALPDGRRLRASRPSIVQLRRDPASERWTMAVGNPTHREGPLRIGIDGPNGASAEHVFDFAPGPYAGQPQTREMQ